MRNRWKRLIREAFRLSREQIAAGNRLFVRPQKEAAADFRRSPIAGLARPADARRVQKRKEGSQRPEVRNQRPGELSFYVAGQDSIAVSIGGDYRCRAIVSIHAEPDFWTAMPLSADMQQLHDRGGREIRGD